MLGRREIDRGVRFTNFIVYMLWQRRNTVDIVLVNYTPLLINLSRPFMIQVPLSLSCCSLGVVLPSAKERDDDDRRSSD